MFQLGVKGTPEIRGGWHHVPRTSCSGAAGTLRPDVPERQRQTVARAWWAGAFGNVNSTETGSRRVARCGARGDRTLAGCPQGARALQGHRRANRRQVRGQRVGLAFPRRLIITLSFLADTAKCLGPKRNLASSQMVQKKVAGEYTHRKERKGVNKWGEMTVSEADLGKWYRVVPTTFLPFFWSSKSCPKKQFVKSPQTLRYVFSPVVLNGGGILPLPPAPIHPGDS